MMCMLKYFAQFFIELPVFVLLICGNYIYQYVNILIYKSTTNPSSYTCIANIFSHSVHCLFTSEDVSFEGLKLLNLKVGQFFTSNSLPFHIPKKEIMHQIIVDVCPI